MHVARPSWLPTIDTVIKKTNHARLKVIMTITALLLPSSHIQSTHWVCQLSKVLFNTAELPESKSAAWPKPPIHGSHRRTILTSTAIRSSIAHHVVLYTSATSSGKHFTTAVQPALNLYTSGQGNMRYTILRSRYLFVQYAGDQSACNIPAYQENSMCRAVQPRYCQFVQNAFGVVRGVLTFHPFPREQNGN